MKKVQRRLVSEEDVKFLVDSGDKFLEEFGKACIGEELSVDEVKEIVACLVQFSVGLRRVGLIDVAKKFDNRLEMVVMFLEKVGFKRGWIGGRWGSRGMLDKLIGSALGKVHLE